MPPPTNRNPSVANVRWSLCQTQAKGARPETLTPRRDPRRFARCSTNAADSCEQHSASPGSLARPTTARSGLSARGSTLGLALGASQSAWLTKASTCSSRGTTRRAGARRSTRAGWSTRRPARPASHGNAHSEDPRENRRDVDGSAVQGFGAVGRRGDRAHGEGAVTRTRCRA